MQRYSISTPLVAVRLFRLEETEKAGGAVVEIHGPSNLGDGMVEVSWDQQRLAVFERDLVTRAGLAQTEAVGS